MPAPNHRVVFVTGTDTGAGKTVLTALLVAHLRQKGRAALALKPFCSGSRADAELLRAVQTMTGLSTKKKSPVSANARSLDQINPFYFPEPLAPLVSARKHHRRITLEQTLEQIRGVATLVNPSIHQSTNPSSAGSVLLIEGSGGLLVPLGEGYDVLDLIVALNCTVLVATRNRLGTLNHTLLTVRALRSAGIKDICVALMDCGKADTSAGSNYMMLRELLSPVPLCSIPFLGPGRLTPVRIAHAARTVVQRSLARIAKLVL